MGELSAQLTEGAFSPSDPAMPGHLPHLANAKQGRLCFFRPAKSSIPFGMELCFYTMGFTSMWYSTVPALVSSISML